MGWSRADTGTRRHDGTKCRPGVRSSIWPLLISWLAFIPLFVHGSPTTQPTTEQIIRRDITDLADREAPVREQARASLMGLSASDLPALRRVVMDSRPLRPSQAAGLREIVTQIFLSGLAYERGQSAFLGVLPVDVVVQMPGSGEAGSRDAVAVSEPMIGFCGYRGLLEGDIVLSIQAGNSVTQIHFARDLIMVIGEQLPGREIEMRILRKGSIVPVRIRLDARPQTAAGEPLDRDEAVRFQADRRKIADEYWAEQFGPLLGANPI